VLSIDVKNLIREYKNNFNIKLSKFDFKVCVQPRIVDSYLINAPHFSKFVFLQNIRTLI